MIDTPRIQRLKEKTAPYIFKTRWQKGTSHIAADALSRRPVCKPTPEDAIAAEDEILDTRMYVRAATMHIDHEMPDPHIERIREETKNDEELQAVINAIRNDGDFPQKFKGLRETLSCTDGIVMHGNRIIIPLQLRKEILKLLHASHMGIVRTKQRARQCVFWPNIGADIEDEIRSCDECQREQASQAYEPMYESDMEATYPFQEVSTDLFEYGGKFFMVMVDRYSGWPTVAEWRHCPSSSDVIKATNRIFADFGVPVRVRSDGGPQFKSIEWLNFLKRKGAMRSLSSPLNPMSNSHAESCVKAMKHLVAKMGGTISNEAFLDGLREFRNTPKAYGQSPAEAMFGRMMRSVIPALSRTYEAPETPSKDIRDAKETEVKEKIKDYFNSRTKPLSKLSIGTRVRVQNQVTKKWDKIGNIIAIGERRSYDVRLENGRVWTRNRRYLRPQAVKFADEVEDVKEEESSPPAPRRSQRPKKQPQRYAPM